MFVHELKELFVSEPDPCVSDYRGPVQHVKRHLAVVVHLVGVTRAGHLRQKVVCMLLEFNVFGTLVLQHWLSEKHVEVAVAENW